MEILEQLEQWLRGFDRWGESVLSVDSAGENTPCGLFPAGLEVLSSRADVEGNIYDRCRQSFCLRCVAVPGREAAGWLMDLQAWVLENQAGAPVFGQEQRLLAQRGKLVRYPKSDTGVYELLLTVEYTRQR